MTSPLDQPDELSATSDVRHHCEARAILADVRQAIGIGAPGNPRIDAKRKARAQRLSGLLADDSIVLALIGQWLTARETQHSLTGIGTAYADCAKLIEATSGLQGTLGAAAYGLKYVATSADGNEVADMAEYASMELTEALTALLRARVAIQRMEDFIPTGARGRAGPLRALRDLTPAEHLAHSLATLWRGHGLTLAGGDDGDGLDLVLDVILGTGAKDALASARRYAASAGGGTK